VPEFSVRMPHLIHDPPPLERFPVPVRNALMYLAGLDIPRDPRDPRGIAGTTLLGPPTGRALAQGLPTLVLDLDETLVHCRIECLNSPKHSFCIRFQETSALGFVYVRPFAHLFLQIAARLFEVVVFTASSRAYADQVLDKLDPDNTCLSARLYRQHCTEVGGAFLKDMRRLGRPLSRVILVDNSPVSLALCPDNGVLVRGWTAERAQDRELMDLLLLLNQCLQHGPCIPTFLEERYGLRHFLDSLRQDDLGLI